MRNRQNEELEISKLFDPLYDEEKEERRKYNKRKKLKKHKEEN